MGLRERPGWLEVYTYVLPTANFSVELMGSLAAFSIELSCVNNNNRFSWGNAPRLGVSDCASDEKRWTNEMLRVPVYSRVLEIVEGSILVMMMARRVGFATVRSEFVSIRFRMAVRRLRGFC